MGTESEQELRARIRAQLPPEVFKRRPERALLVIPLVAMIVAGSATLVAVPLPWYVALAGSLLIGSVYVSLMLLGHEIGHGATVRSHRLQDLCLYFACGVYCLSPHLWRIWHGQVHHPHANMEGRDPDQFGTLHAFNQRGPLHRFLINTAPGSGHPLSFVYPFLFFTLQAQGVLWIQSRSMRGFERLQHRRAALDTVLMTLFWLSLSLALGPWATLYVVVIPMLIANFGLMSYIITNHMLRPMTDTYDTLSTTISVTTFKFLDVIHFNFSHHVEHHLFPAVPGSSYPLIRQTLRRLAPDRYLAPPHWWAFVLTYRTPKIYETPHVLIEPYSGRRVRIVDVETLMTEMLT